MGPARNAGVEGDVARVAPHHFQDHDSIVAGGGEVEPIEGFRGNVHGCVKPDRLFRGGHIVIDRFGNPHKGHAHFRHQIMKNFQAAITANANNGR